MRKHYGQVVKTCIKIAFASALLLIISGVLSYAIKGKVIAILEIIAGIIAFSAVIFIRKEMRVLIIFLKLWRKAQIRFRQILWTLFLYLSLLCI